MSRSKITIICIALSLASACAAPSAQHSADAAGHSAAAVSHGAVAATMSGATVAAVPLVVGGASLAVTGAALQSAGNISMQGGAEVLDATLGAPQRCASRDNRDDCITPDAPPAL